MASTVGAAQYLTLKGVPPKFTTKLRAFERTGYNGQGYHDTGKHGNQGEITGQVTFSSIALRVAFEKAVANQVGSTVSIVDDLGVTYDYYKIIEILRETKMTTASSTDSKNYYYEVTYLVQPTAANITAPS